MSGQENYPLVTIGMPIRNGGEFFPIALASVLAQEYPNLEIIISDNYSQDNTAQIVADAILHDPRIRSVKPSSLLNAFEHFEFVMQQAKGEYFVWAAHDDVRAKNYVTQLVKVMQTNPKAVLAFGDLYVTDEMGKEGKLKIFNFDNSRWGAFERMRKTALQQCYHIYGVWRISVLRRIPFISNPWWPDLPIMIAAAGIGSFIHVPGVRFHYYEIPKTNIERAQYQDNMKGFNWRNRIRRTLLLPIVTFRTSFYTLGLIQGFAALIAVSCRIGRDFLIYFLRKLGLSKYWGQGDLAQ